MKSTILTTALAAFGFAMLPIHADDASAKPATEPVAAATDEAAENTTPVYIVQVTGQG